MENLILKVFEMIDNKEYVKLIKIAIGGLTIIAPSFSYIFLYKRYLFEKLETIELLILCIILNLIILGILTSIIFIKIELAKELNIPENKILRQRLELVFFPNMVAPMIWANYMIYYILSKEGIYKSENISIMFILGIITYQLFGIFKNSYKLKEYRICIGTGFIGIVSGYYILELFLNLYMK